MSVHTVTTRTSRTCCMLLRSTLQDCNLLAQIRTRLIYCLFTTTSHPRQFGTLFGQSSVIERTFVNCRTCNIMYVELRVCSIRSNSISNGTIATKLYDSYLWVWWTLRATIQHLCGSVVVGFVENAFEFYKVGATRTHKWTVLVSWQSAPITPKQNTSFTAQKQKLGWTTSNRYSSSDVVAAFFFPLWGDIMSVGKKRQNISTSNMDC